MWTIHNYKAVFVYSFLFLFSLIISVVFCNPLYLLIPFVFLFVEKLFSIAITKTRDVFLLLIFCLPLSTEWQVTENLSLDFPTEPILILLSFLGVCKWLYHSSNFPTHLLKSNLFFLVVLHLIWLLINIFYSSHPLLSLKFFVAKVWYVVPFIVILQFVFQSINDVNKIIRFLVLTMLVVVVQSLIRHGFQAFSFEGIKYTLHPFFRNHVNYGATLVLLFPLLIFLKPFAKEYGQKYFFNVQNTFTILFLIGLFFAYSRGAWLAVLIGFIGSLSIKYNKVKAVVISAIVMVVLSLFILLNKNTFLKLAPQFNTTIYHSSLTDHLEATVALKDVSNAERLYRWVAGFNIITERPIVGFGTNTFYHHYKQYTAQIFKTWVSSNNDHSTVHNYFLLTLIEQGIIGFLLFCCLMIIALLKAQYLYNEANNLKYKQLAKAIGVMLIMTIVLNFLSDLIETDKVGALFWLCIGLLIWLDHKIHLNKAEA
jgi:O-antigen ligase